MQDAIRQFEAASSALNTGIESLKAEAARMGQGGAVSAPVTAPAVLGCGRDHPEILDDRGSMRIFQRGKGFYSWQTLTRVPGGWIGTAHGSQGIEPEEFEPVYGKCRVLHDIDIHVYGDPKIPDVGFADRQHVTVGGFPARSRFFEQTAGRVVFTVDEREPYQAIFKADDGHEPASVGQSGGPAWDGAGNTLGILRAEGSVDTDGDGRPEFFFYAVSFRTIRKALAAA